MSRNRNQSAAGSRAKSASAGAEGSSRATPQNASASDSAPSNAATRAGLPPVAVAICAAARNRPVRASSSASAPARSITVGHSPGSGAARAGPASVLVGLVPGRAEVVPLQLAAVGVDPPALDLVPAARHGLVQV